MSKLEIIALSEVVHINENQAGFSQHHSTLDHIFTLQSFIDIFISERYIYFVFLIIIVKHLTPCGDQDYGKLH